MRKSLRFAVLPDIHLAPPGTPDGAWNNVTRLSASGELLSAVVADIIAAGHESALLLGDVSEFGDRETIAAALRVISGAGLRLWAVPGNHDVSRSPGALAEAIRRTVGNSDSLENFGEAGLIAVRGHGLLSDDGGRTCQATGLPDLAGVHTQLLLWVSHYPVLSQWSRLREKGLRYPGDLLNLDGVISCIGNFPGPVLVLHGHLHAMVVQQAGSILQIGVPAVVEWPHAWTDASIEVTDDAVAVHTITRPIPGAWSVALLNTALADREQRWVFTSGQWSRILAVAR